MWLALTLACSPPAPVPAGAPPPPPTAPADEAEAEAPRTPANRPPMVPSVTLTPAEARFSDTLLATTVAADPEGDPVTLDYSWTVNGARVVDVASERLPAGRFKKGDSIAVTATASDGTNEASRTSAPLVIGNTAPAFTTGPRDMKKVDGFAFSASDPDADPLSWRLEDAPSGMTISATGVLSYTGAADEKGGRYTVAVLVDDGQAWGRFEFPVTVSPGSGATKKTKDAEPERPKPRN